MKAKVIKTGEIVIVEPSEYYCADNGTLYYDGELEILCDKGTNNPTVNSSRS